MVTASICAGTGDLIHQLGFEDKRLDEVEVRRLLLSFPCRRLQPS